ncbi:MAG: flagellar export chaperone FliS [Gammaproteobacteria bacterium]|nr:flagellar export chaperone FliS [Gammaproteobacteria bacterium]
MRSSEAKSAIDKYAKMNTRTAGEYANPHRLIQMLMEGALEKIATAKGYMERKEIADKGVYISWAISIIDGLRISLDHKNGGELASNLEAVYDYMQRRLVEANIHNKVEMLDEVSGLIRSIKEAWDNIPTQIDVEQFKQTGI